MVKTNKITNNRRGKVSLPIKGRSETDENKGGETPPLQKDLPEGWGWKKIRDICNLINGRAFKPSEWATQGLPIIGIQNLN